MPTDFNTARYDFHIPWFMLDIDNFQLITSPTLPTDIIDTKDIVLSETPIPGLNFRPVNYGGGGNRKLTFTLPLIKRNNTVGNVLLLKQFDQLRNQAVGLTGVFTAQFTPNPRVLYYYGTGSIPLVYFVKKADPTNKRGWVNELGNPQYSEINMELWLDETNPLYRAEEVFRKLAAITGVISTVYDIVLQQQGKRTY